ncbi:carbamoyl-phosphate synthase [Arthrobacter sp.]|uniref:carboxylate--amine ligase n=1 Tax=Arthrobacter sp. TaxID=1667 RepID=UPI003A92794A
MRILDSQPFVPVILGGDIGTYSLAREFHEAYGAVSVAVPAGTNGVLEHSVAIDIRPAGTMTDEAAVVEHLLSVARELTANGANPRPLLLFGSLDLQVGIITGHREELEPWYTIPYPDTAVIERAAHKQNFYALCAELDIPHPLTVTYDPVSPRPLPADLPFPLIGKPADSSAWVHAKFAGKQKVHTIAGADELDDLLARIRASGYASPFILQEMIPGGDANMRLCTFYSDRDARVRFAAYGEVVVEEHAPLVLGNSAGIVTGVNAEFTDQGRRILEHLGWTGFSMFDAKLDPRDGVVKFFELNPRLGRNHYYLTAAGHNAARFYVREYLGPGYDDGALPAAAGDAPPVVASEQILYTVLPLSLLRRHLRGPVGEKARELMRAHRVANPLLYRAERDPRRLWYIALTSLNQFRKFRRHPPRL